MVRKIPSIPDAPVVSHGPSTSSGLVLSIYALYCPAQRNTPKKMRHTKRSNIEIYILKLQQHVPFIISNSPDNAVIAEVGTGTYLSDFPTSRELQSDSDFTQFFSSLRQLAENQACVRTSVRLRHKKNSSRGYAIPTTVDGHTE